MTIWLKNGEQVNFFDRHGYDEIIREKLGSDFANYYEKEDKTLASLQEDYDDLKFNYDYVLRGDIKATGHLLETEALVDKLIKYLQKNQTPNNGKVLRDLTKIAEMMAKLEKDLD